jgi:hypothetical protein
MDSDIITYEFNPMHDTKKEIIEEPNKYYCISFTCCYYKFIF